MKMTKKHKNDTNFSANEVNDDWRKTVSDNRNDNDWNIHHVNSIPVGKDGWGIINDQNKKDINHYTNRVEISTNDINDNDWNVNQFYSIPEGKDGWGIIYDKHEKIKKSWKGWMGNYIQRK